MNRGLMTNDRAKTLRSRLILGTAITASAFTGGGYIRRVYAACVAGPPGTYNCSGTLNTTQSLSGTPLTVTTEPGFSITTAAGNAFDLTGTGGLTFTDTENSTITGDYSGIEARNSASGAITITTTGTVTGLNSPGLYGKGIYARNNAGTGDVTISAVNASGGTEGINVRHYGAGATSITATGTVTGTTSTGILAVGYGSTTGLTIRAAEVSGGYDGIRGAQYGSGALSITATGTVTGAARGIVTDTGTSTTGLTINAVNVTGGSIGISANHAGSGALSITTTGTVTGTGSTAIFAIAGSTSNGLTINAVNANGAYDGIRASHNGAGALSITTTGMVTGTGMGRYGILAETASSATDLTISAVDVSGAYQGIRAAHNGTGAVDITATGTVTGNGGAGISVANDSATADSTSEVMVESGSIVSGTTAGIALSSTTGREATIENEGTIQNNSGATTDNAINSIGAGDVRINNDSIVIGTVTTEAGNDIFDEGSSSSWHTAGGVNDFGAGSNSIINDGLIVAAAEGAAGPVTTTFQATGGTLTFNSNTGGVLGLGNGVAGDVAHIGNAGQTNGNFVTNGGMVQIDTVLGDDSSLTDLLVVNGNTASVGDATLLQVNNVGGTGAQTTEGIKVVDVAGTSDGIFTLLGEVVINGEQALLAGAYAYSLNQGGITDPDDGDWYLRSLGFTPSATAYESYPVVLLDLIDMPTMQQRVGNVYMPNVGSYTDGFVNPEPAADVAQPAYVPLANFWTRIEAAYGHYEGDSDTGTEYDLDRYKVQVGIDGRLGQSDDGMLIAGINAQYGHADADLESDTGDGDNSTDSYGGGLTLTWLGASGFYADAQAMAHYLESDLSSDVLGELVDNNEGWGYGLSLELGRKFALDDTFSITPQAQLAYTSVDFDDFTDPQGLDVSLDEGESLRGRIGLALNHDSFGDGETRGHVYTIANLTYEFLGEQSVDIAGVDVEFEPEEFGGELGLGGTYEWAQGKYAIHGEALGQTSFEGSYGVKGTAGFSTRF